MTAPSSTPAKKCFCITENRITIGMSATIVPRASHHSRTDGRRHGIVSAVEWRGGIAALSLATREIVFLERKIRDDDRPAAA